MAALWTHWDLEQTTDQILTLWIDVQGESQNMFSTEVMSELDAVIKELESRQGVKTVFIRSRKSNSFFAGADIHEFVKIETIEQAREVSRRGQDVFARLEALDATTIAVIQGACLGGGLEMALACDHRIAIIDSATRIGLPETGLGILPGWGGTQRLPRHVDLLQAIGMILQAKKLSAEKAVKVGLVDRAVKPGELETLLKDLGQSSDDLKPHKSSTWLGWFLNQTSFGRNLIFNATEKRIARQKVQYPALGKSLEAIRLSFKEDASGFEFEQQAIGDLLFTPACQSLVSLFLNKERARSLDTWNVPTSIQEEKIQSMAVLGGGTMGAGIAQAGIKKGMQVVLKEVNDEALDAARSRIHSIYETLLDRKSLSEAEANEQQAQLTYTTSQEEISDVDVIIEAVPESLDLKQKIFNELAGTCDRETIFATNTSALSVDEIFAGVEPKSRVGGLHFFNPVHRMDLIEVISGAYSSPETVGRLLQLAKQLGKTPIVTKDSPGFVVNRILMPYLDEAIKIAIEMTAQNREPSVIDREMKSFGMPMGPLELIDQVGVDVAAHVAGSMTIVFGEKSDSATVLKRMVDAKRLGRKSDAGFYNYVKGKKTNAIGLQPLVSEIDVDLVEPPTTELDEVLTPIQQRLVLAMVNEAGRCLDEGVVAEGWMIDLAMVLGTGFAPFRGGPLKFAKQLNHNNLIETLEKLAEVYGERFQPSDSIRQLDH
ncbi:3-hydroxyacyl-CoA dehydrogenase NAD-binding domain-containing protein [uncultured Rubinisphaera sp.]|uniref:3-hydroxyacyl-CoA dehydrogenase NAD-binding domain-containing protein n=1 Tax=uncultured Rubinisphaera sp. TaxID=1678686 RepID=UPI0030DA0736